MSTLTVRKLNVDLSRGFARHWMGGDVYRTAFMNALSMSFPLGEQMFIDSVRAVPADTIADPALRAEVKDFIGQEASHRYVHQQYNAELARQCPGDLLLGDEAALDEHAAQLAPGALLVGEGGVQLLFRQQLLLHQDFAEPDFFWPRHDTL